MGRGSLREEAKETVGRPERARLPNIFAHPATSTPERSDTRERASIHPSISQAVLLHTSQIEAGKIL